jgi:hypothetical protein
VLTEIQKVALRRHLFYPAIGLPVVSPSAGLTYASGAAGYRYFNAFGFLEWKMGNLAPIEEATLVGAAYGSVALLAVPNPAFQVPGNQLFVPSGASGSVTIAGTFSGSPVTFTYTAPQAQTPLQFIAGLAAAGAASSVLQAAGFFVVAPYGAGDASPQNVLPVPYLSVVNPAIFTITATASGGIGLTVISAGGLVPPSAVTTDPISKSPVTTYGYVPILNLLESAMVAATENMDTLEAGGPGMWRWNPDEFRDRAGQYKSWACGTARFLGLPLGTDSAANIYDGYEGRGTVVLT